jgi:hypothetical protein
MGGFETFPAPAASMKKDKPRHKKKTNDRDIREQHTRTFPTSSYYRVRAHPK